MYFHCFRWYDWVNEETRKPARFDKNVPVRGGKRPGFDALKMAGRVLSSEENVLDARALGRTWKAISVINVIFCSERPRKWLVDSRRAAHCYIRHDAWPVHNITWYTRKWNKRVPRNVSSALTCVLPDNCLAPLLPLLSWFLLVPPFVFHFSFPSFLFVFIY